VEEQGFQEAGARWPAEPDQAGQSYHKIKIKRSRRAPEPSLTPTSLLPKFQQQGKQIKNKQ
jgi:hypothetical protein